MVSGRSALILAVMNGHMSMCDFLIRRGVDINATDIYGNTALMIAAEKNCVDLCQTLIEKEAI